MTYTLHTYKLNLTTNKYELEETITCEFLNPTNFDSVEPCDYKYTFKHEYQFIYY